MILFMHSNKLFHSGYIHLFPPFGNHEIYIYIYITNNAERWTRVRFIESCKIYGDCLE